MATNETESEADYWKRKFHEQQAIFMDTAIEFIKVLLQDRQMMRENIQRLATENAKVPILKSSEAR